MSDPRPTCPRCHSQHTVKNGRIHNKKPKYQCQNCQKQFVEKSTKKVIAGETLELIDRLLLEKHPLILQPHLFGRMQVVKGFDVLA